MKGKERIIITIIALFIFSFMSIGYAMYEKNIFTSGNAKFIKNGEVYLSSAILTNHKNLLNPADPIIDGNNIEINLHFNVSRTEESLNDEYSATYTITITNDSFYDYNYSSSGFSPSVNMENQDDMEIIYMIEGIENNEIIPSKESKTFTATIRMIPNKAGDYNITGEAGIDITEESQEGSLLGSIPKNISGDLSGNNEEIAITATVVNTYETEKSFTFTSSSSNFYLTDSNGQELNTYTISGNTTDTYTFYIRVKDTARFASEHQSINLYFNPTEQARTSMGVVAIKVDVDPTITDTEPPTIQNVTATFLAEKGNVEISYEGSDNLGISHYVIETYKIDGNTEQLISTNQTLADENTYNITGLEDGTYYFKVQAIDTSDLTSTSQSPQYDFRWTMNVTVTINNGGPNTTTTIDYGKTYTTTITANANRVLPTTLTITMGNETLDNSKYTYSNNTGALSVPNVTGDLVINGSAPQGGCVIEGTKVKLANGKEKNVEKINYDDLLLVWNYETGKTTKEYPIWIENAKESETYTEIKFSDNTKIKVVGSHAFFSVDYNQFISYNDQEKFHIGTNILKLTKNKKLKKVQVTGIEQKQEKVKYYFIASTRYYNIISNNFITTDGYTEITNLYPFDENISWPSDRQIKEIDYSYLKDILPYYMYKGFRAGELAILLENNKITIDEFKEYLITNILNPQMLKNPFKQNDHRIWPVSLDKKKKWIEEGKYYTLPKENDWYSTAENKIYKAGEKVRVWTGMHFEKIQKTNK